MGFMQLLMHETKWKQWKDVFSNISNLRTNCHLKLISKQGYTEGKWLIHGTKHHNGI